MHHLYDLGSQMNNMARVVGGSRWSNPAFYTCCAGALASKASDVILSLSSEDHGSVENRLTQREQWLRRAGSVFVIGMLGLKLCRNRHLLPNHPGLLPAEVAVGISFAALFGLDEMSNGGDDSKGIILVGLAVAGSLLWLWKSTNALAAANKLTGGSFSVVS